MSQPLAMAGGEALARLAAAPAAVLFLDLDGTLAPFVDQPERARIPPATRRTLARLQHTGARVVLVSGRRVRSAVAVARCPVAAVIGNHGADILLGGRHRPWIQAEAAPLRDAVRVLAPLLEAWPGSRLEVKDFSLGVHWRGPAARLDPLLHAVRRALRHAPLSVNSGRRVVDVKPDGVSKGTAVIRWLSTVERNRIPPQAILYAGDDTTDQDAFRVLPAPATTIAVGPRTHGARYRTRNTMSLARWLKRLARARSHLNGSGS